MDGFGYLFWCVDLFDLFGFNYCFGFGGLFIFVVFVFDLFWLLCLDLGCFLVVCRVCFVCYTVCGGVAVLLTGDFVVLITFNLVLFVDLLLLVDWLYRMFWFLVGLWTCFVGFWWVALPKHWFWLGSILVDLVLWFCDCFGWVFCSLFALCFEVLVLFWFYCLICFVILMFVYSLLICWFWRWVCLVIYLVGLCFVLRCLVLVLGLIVLIYFGWLL